jgi:hypothetical protein
MAALDLVLQRGRGDEFSAQMDAYEASQEAKGAERMRAADTLLVAASAPLVRLLARSRLRVPFSALESTARSIRRPLRCTPQTAL